LLKNLSQLFTPAQGVPATSLVTLSNLSELSAPPQGVPATSLAILSNLNKLSAPPQAVPVKSLVKKYGDDVEQEVTFLIDDVLGVYDSGECVVLFFEANKTPEVFAEDPEDVDELLYNYFDAFLASEKPADLPFTGRKVVKAELGIEVPEDLKQVKVAPLASLHKVKFIGMGCDLVVYDDELWAFKYSADSEDLEEILEQIRRLEQLGASGATHFAPLHAIILDSYNHLRGFIMPYQVGGSLVQFHKAGLQAAQAEGAGAAAGSAMQKSGDRPQPIQSPPHALIWRYSTRLSWATQLAKAVAEMHRLDMVHGDIKPENTVIDTNGRLLLIDVYCDGFTDEFAAPEVLAHLGEPEFISKQHDIYTVGMSMVAILEESPNLTPPTFPLEWNPDNRTPPSLRKLIMGCLCPKPEDRPSIDHIVYTLERACRFQSDSGIFVQPAL